MSVFSAFKEKTRLGTWLQDNPAVQPILRLYLLSFNATLSIISTNKIDTIHRLLLKHYLNFMSKILENRKTLLINCNTCDQLSKKKHTSWFPRIIALFWNCRPVILLLCYVAKCYVQEGNGSHSKPIHLLVIPAPVCLPHSPAMSMFSSCANSTYSTGLTQKAAAIELQAHNLFLYSFVLHIY